jgi:hypothetical protein
MEMNMTTYYLVHIDDYGERHQLDGCWRASDPAAAIALMLKQAGEIDDGRWLAIEWRPAECDQDYQELRREKFINNAR